VLLGVVLGEVCEQPGVEGATFWFKRFFSRWWFQPSEKYKPVGIIIPSIWKKIMFQATNQY
jgi:hypothetical protein